MLTNLGVLANGTNADIVTAITGAVFVPRTPEHFSFDADGNLTGDGRWTNRWDAENRLIEIESLPLSEIPAGAKWKLRFAYDDQGRRFSLTVSNWTGSAWALSRQRKFLVFSGSDLRK